jgi:hypothetical protein
VRSRLDGTCGALNPVTSPAFLASLSHLDEPEDSFALSSTDKVFQTLALVLSMDCLTPCAEVCRRRLTVTSGDKSALQTSNQR